MNAIKYETARENDCQIRSQTNAIHLTFNPDSVSVSRGNSPKNVRARDPIA